MIDLKTTAEFLEVLTGALQGQETQENIKEYRYVIYARKSTDYSEKQVRSLSDQVLECRDFGEEKKQKIKDLMLEYHKDEKIKNVYMGDLLKLDADIEENQKNLDRVQSRITKEKHSILTYAEFIELFDTMATTLAQIQNMKDLDSLVKKMFLNFTIREKNITEFTLNVPFKALYDLKISNCAQGGT